MAFLGTAPILPRASARAVQACSKIPHASLATGPERPRKIVLYDGVCGLCNSGVQLLLKLDREEKFSFAALQSERGMDLLRETGAPTDLSTVVYVDDGTSYTYSDAVLKIGEGLSLPYAPLSMLTRVLVPRPFRDAFYTNVIANNRYWVFGRNDSCILIQPGYEDRFLS